MNNRDIESTLGCEVIKQLPQDVVDKIAAGEGINMKLASQDLAFP